MPILEIILEPLQYGFMTKAILVSSLVGVVCAVLSCFMVLKRWSLMGDAVSHAVLPGVVISYILGLPFAVGAFFFGFLSVIIIGFVRSTSRIKEDAIMGIVFTTLFALGLILISRTPSDVDLFHILFGYVLGISDSDALLTFVIGIITLIAIFIKRKDFILFTFDQAHAQAIGINTTILEYSLLTLLALTIVASMQTVGIILVIAMLVIPGSIAYLLTDSFSRLVGIAVLSSVFASVAGTYISFYTNISTGGSIVFFLGSLFFLVYLVAPKYGVLKLGR